MGGGHDLHQGLEALITKAGLNMDDFDAPTMSAVLAAHTSFSLGRETGSFVAELFPEGAPDLGRYECHTSGA